MGTGNGKLPPSGADVLDWTWDDYAPHARHIAEAPLSAASVDTWLRDWTALSALLREQGARLRNRSNADTREAGPREALTRFFEQVVPQASQWNQDLKEKLLGSGLAPDGMAIALRSMRAEAERFRAENLPLITAEQKLVQEYDRTAGAVTAQFDGRPQTLSELRLVQQEPDRGRREAAWRAGNAAFHAQREKLAEIWAGLLDLRREIASNAGCQSYTEYVWPLKHRFEYGPPDCVQFHQAIEATVVPALARRHERQAGLLGLERLRPWDTACDPLGRAPLRPFADSGELEAVTSGIFERIDPQLGAWFSALRDGHLDLPSRPGKAPGGWCNDYPVVKRAFIFMNAVGTHDDVQTLLHEAGHAFHGFSTYPLPYWQQRDVPMEFAEVASMAMELIAAPWLTRDKGGFYSEADAARARTEHLERILTIWCGVAVGDALQQWIYANPEEARDAEAVSAKYGELNARFLPAIDHTGLEDWRDHAWQRILHFYVVPHYYIEYGIAQLGAVQIMGASQRDHAAALERYKVALALGGTVPLPELFSVAGARFGMDRATFEPAVALIEEQFAALGAA